MSGVFVMLVLTLGVSAVVTAGGGGTDSFTLLIFIEVSESVLEIELNRLDGTNDVKQPTAL